MIKVADFEQFPLSVSMSIVDKWKEGLPFMIHFKSPEIKDCSGDLPDSSPPAVTQIHDEASENMYFTALNSSFVICERTGASLSASMTNRESVGRCSTTSAKCRYRAIIPLVLHCLLISCIIGCVLDRDTCGTAVIK